MGEGAHLPPQPLPTWESTTNARARPGRAPAPSPDTHNSPLPDFSQFFIHSTGTTTVAAAIFPSLVAEARMCSTRARGQRGAPPTGNAGSCEFGFRFPAPLSSPPAETRGPACNQVAETRGSLCRVTTPTAPSIPLALLPWLPFRTGKMPSPGRLLLALLFFRNTYSRPLIQSRYFSST